MMRTLIFVLLLMVGCTSAQKAYRITDDGSEMVQQYSQDMASVEASINVYALDRSRIESPPFLVECVASHCDAALDDHEKVVLSIYASFLNAVSEPLTVPYKVGILRADDNVNGMFAISDTGEISFWVKVYKHGERHYDVTANRHEIVRLMELAVHERAHYDNFVDGYWGHGDEFQIVFNTLFSRSIEDTDAYVRLAHHIAGVEREWTFAEIALYILIPCFAIAMMYVVYTCCCTRRGRVRRKGQTSLSNPAR